VKLILFFDLARKEIDLEYRRIFISFIKGSIVNIRDGKYYQYCYGGNRQKDFTFSVILNKPQFQNHRIILGSNQIKMIFSTSDKKLGMIFFNSFIARKNKGIKLANQNEMVMTKIVKGFEQEIKKETVLIKMLSPLVIREHIRENNQDYYYSVASENFSEIARNNIISQLKKSGYQESYLSNFKINPVNAKKTVITHYGCKIEASIGIFELHGNTFILNYLLKAGIGGRHSEGFGTAQIIEG